MTRACRKLHKGELRGFYFSSYIIRLIKIKEEETMEHTAHVETRNPCTVCEERDQFEDLGVNGRTVSNMCYINNIQVFGFYSPGMS